MTKRTSQKERILSYLRSGRKLTGLYATNTLRIMDYRKRISELIRDGYDIRSEWAKEKGRPFKKYYLAKE